MPDPTPPKFRAPTAWGRLARAVIALSLLAVATTSAHAAPLDDAARAFAARTGARLVFDRADLPAGDWYDQLPTLSAQHQLRAARLLLDEAAKYPRGYLGAIGVRTIGVFAACVSNDNDGFHSWDDTFGGYLCGYLYYGVWNGKDAIAAAYYSDGQLPLTFHHEVFHAVDAARDGAADRDANFASDDARFTAAVRGERRYPAARIAAPDLERLAAVGRGRVLEGAVAHYATKNAGEDQAETARWMMTNLADALVQVARRPELAGSQRMLHLLGEYRGAAADGPGLGWFIDVALGRADRTAQATVAPRDADVARLVALAAGPLADLGDVLTARRLLARFASGATDALGKSDRARLAQAALNLTPRLGRAQARANDDDTAFTVWTSQSYEGGANSVLRDDVTAMGRDAEVLAAIARATGGVDSDALARAELLVLRVLARYYAFIGQRWTITAGTAAAFDDARGVIVRALPAGAAPIADAVDDASLTALAAGLTPDGRLASGGLPVARPRDPAPAPARAERRAPPADNPYLHKVADAIGDPTIRAAIRAVQPAAVKLGGGSGVNLAPEGLVITNAHVAKQVGATYTVLFPDGRTFPGRTVAIDGELDLALVALTSATGLPIAPVSRRAPRVGDFVAIIGNPGTSTPDGEPTGYQRFHVSTGKIRGFLDDPLGDQSLGRTKHDAWTYWGHSGSPLFDRRGAIIALHNSWDSTTAMRHAVTWQAIVHFLAAHDAAYSSR